MPTDTEILVTELRADFRRFEASLRRNARSVARNTRTTERRFNRMTNRISRDLNFLARDARRALAAVSLGLVTREVLEFADAYTDAQNKIAAAGTVAGFAGRDLDSLRESAAEARSELAPYADLYARILRASQGVAQSEAEVAAATQLAAKAFRAGGASAQEQAAGILQLGQALGSGFLQGDELRSLRENAPLIAKAIADEFETTIGGLKKLGAEGALTSDRVFRAILNASDDIEQAFGVTIPRATDSTRLAFDNLRFEIGKFLSNSDTVRTAGDAVAAAINFVAENVELLAQTLIFAGVAFAGGAFAGGIQNAIKNLDRAKISAISARGAFIALRSVLISFALPVGLGLLAAYMVNLNFESQRTVTTMRSLEDALTILAGLQISDEIELSADEMARLALVTDDAVDSLVDLTGRQREAIEALRNQNDVIAAQTEIRKRNALATLQEARAEAAAELERQRRIATRSRGAVGRASSGRGSRRGNSRIVLERAQAQLEESTRLAEDLAGYVEVLDRGIEGLQSGLLEFADTPTGGSPSADPLGLVDKDKTEDALDAIEKAFQDTFEKERMQIARIRDERLKAIDDAVVGEQRAAELRSKVLAIYEDELRDIIIAESEAAQRRFEIEKTLAEDQLEIVRQVIDARDQLLGRTIAISLREYEARKRYIERSVLDERQRNEALRALAEERAAFEEEARRDALGFGDRDKGVEGEIEQVRVEQDAKLAVVRDALATGIVLEEEAAQRRIEINRLAEEQIVEIRRRALSNQLQAGEELFNELTALAGTFVGEQSGIYKTLFGISKAFAIADSIIKIQQGIANALSLPFPANISAAASTAAAASGIVATIQGQTVGFRRGGYTGGGGVNEVAGVVHGREYVFDAEATKRIGVGNLEALRSARTLSTPPMVGSSPPMSISVGGSPLVVQGSLDSATLPEVRRMMAAQSQTIIRQLPGAIRSGIQDYRSRTTARAYR